MNKRFIKHFIGRVQDELEDNILPFWLEHIFDSKNGGFVGELSNDLAEVADAHKGLVLNTRLLWAFSAMGAFTKNERCFAAADYAYQLLRKEFWDEHYGGGFWTLDKDGAPAVRLKKTYGQGFFVYGLAEYYLRSGDISALNLAQTLFHLIETHAFDTEHSGYFEVLEEDWRLCRNQQLSEEDLNAPKSMNTHLHLMEAYTHLYSAWQDPLLAKRLRGLIDIFRHKILDAATGHFQLFFDAAWHSRNGHISFGHDIEGSWLLCRAADVLGDPVLQEETAKIAIQITEAVHREGLDSHYGLIYASDGNGALNPEAHFWCQAEAVVGFLNAFQLSKQPHFLESAWKTWQFIENYQVDKEYGEWFWRLDANHRPDRSMPKISEWKCPYHNGRACIETAQRLKALLHEPVQKKRKILVYGQERKIAGDPSASKQISAIDK